MNNYIQTNSNVLLDKIIKIKNLSTVNIKKSKCPKCSMVFYNEYIYNNLKFDYLDIHLLSTHFLIKEKLYEKISLINVDFINNFVILNTNSLNIIDSVYEDGSKQKYIDNNKTVFNSKINRFSEHAGFISCSNNKVDKIIFLNNNRIDKNDPLIYQPKNSLEALKMDYIFHTHPKTPYIGSRIKYGMIYEFPSLNDILHFVEHHNEGKLLGSLVMTPEGIYNIHKYLFNKDKIKIDYDLFLNELEYIYIKCYNESYEKYKNINNKKYKINNFIKIPDKYFYNNISVNFDYITRINNELIKYDLYIDFYPRIKLINTDYWILPNIFLPIL
jgi:hypothetical protein